MNENLTVGQLATHGHPRAGFVVALPGAWVVHLDPNPQLALVALSPEADPWGFRSNAVVVLDELDPGMTLWAWQDGADQLLPNQLRDYLLIDRQPIRVGERAGVRRLAHHNADGRSVTMAQWATARGSQGYTLTASVSTLAYPSLAETLTRIGAGFRVDRPPR